ncbi:MAG: SemiSWEET transporter [Leeuwenhoekiella sp.]
MWDFDFVELIGVTAAILTTSAFAPQLIHTIKTKDVAGLSLTMYLTFLAGLLLWLVYGIYMKSISIILANVVTSIQAVVLIFLKIRYGKRGEKRE